MNSNKVGIFVKDEEVIQRLSVWVKVILGEEIVSTREYGTSRSCSNEFNYKCPNTVCANRVRA